jgi:hypothetical protein
MISSEICGLLIEMSHEYQSERKLAHLAYYRDILVYLYCMMYCSFPVHP